MRSSILFAQFVVNARANASGNAKQTVTINATIKFNFCNRDTFFGVNVSSTRVNFAYTKLTLASGDIKKFYQSRNGHIPVSVNLQGRGVQLYDGSVIWSSQVPLNLNFTVKTKAYVLGKSIKPKFHRKIYCVVVYKPTKVNVPISLKKSCTV
ncbi:hypothetical protein L2E82_01947 [Cichorium intybus]|uniref:Uncharacterized protein n=1 Tax=Cichorium intybus TaxID=13427 RepID=A0ACB9GZZ2_CICIN|nr:hypothetical protein L2E82_01947 [Cichorium intybus]